MMPDDVFIECNMLLACMTIFGLELFDSGAQPGGIVNLGTQVRHIQCNKSCFSIAMVSALLNVLLPACKVFPEIMKHAIQCSLYSVGCWDAHDDWLAYWCQ